MTAPGVFTPYSTIRPLLGALPGWVDAVDKERIASYQKYEEIYWSSESGFDTVMRGDNESPVLMPSARTLVNTVNRYTCPEFNYRVEGTDTTAVTVAQLAFDKLFAREEFLSKFNSNKLYGGIRGDWLWHVVANPTKPLGQRLSIYAVDPASYFPVYSEDEPDRIVAVHLAEQVTYGGKPAVSRLTYRKVLDENGVTTGITREHALFEPDKWWLATKPVAVVLAMEELDPRIRFLPVWHLKNFDANAPFGSSNLRGLESVLLGINQATSDEDMTLALEGLGVYATDGAAPVDENNNEVDWILGPARVLTKANGLRRITGASNFTGTYGAHIDRLWSAAKESVGASDVAVGAPGPGVEAGIALQIRLGPILAYTAVQDQHIIDKHKQFFHDLQFLFEVYEELPMLMEDGAGGLTPKVQVVPTIGKKVPANLTEVITQVVALRNCVPPVISLRSSHDLLRAAGMNLPDNELDILAEEALGTVDPLAEPPPDDEAGDDARLAEEMA